MEPAKIRILEKALSIINETINDDLYDWLLDYTNARPGDTAYFLGNLIKGLKQANKESTNESS